MHITIINDCEDHNAAGRQLARAGLLFEGASLSYVGVPAFSELAAAGNLIDMLDTHEGAGIILANCAPRHAVQKEFTNGTPFGYFWYKETLVVTTIAGRTLSLVKKLSITSELQVFDIKEVAPLFAEFGITSQEKADRVPQTQFRSLDFLPRAARLVFDMHADKLTDKQVPTKPHSMETIANAPKAVWWLDNFGNAKTTLLPEDIGFEEGKQISFKGHTLTCTEHLAKVPDSAPALVVGSSGIDEKRFLEIVVQGKSAKSILDLAIGETLDELVG